VSGMRAKIQTAAKAGVSDLTRQTTINLPEKSWERNYLGRRYFVMSTRQGSAPC
jgi:hypothetical protein